MSEPPVLSRQSSVGEKVDFPSHIGKEKQLLESSSQVEVERLRLLQLEKRLEIETLLNERMKFRSENAKPDISGDASDASEGNARILESLVERLELPRVELLRFDGNPLQYWQFIRNFETSVEKKTGDNNKRLSCLIQQCDGMARSAIQSCVMLDHRGYNEARRILQERFGQNFMIARAHIDRLLKLPPLRTNDPQALSEFAQELSVSYITLMQMKYESDLNAHTTLRSIVSKLPSHLKFKWADVAAKIQIHGSEPDFSDLLNFVEERALISNTEFGQLASMRSTVDDQSRRLPVNRASRQPSRGSSFALQGSTTNVQCLMCKGSHFLDQCPEFSRLSFDDRFQFVKQHKLCLLCLKPNHITKSCRLRRFCTKEGCGGCHHTLLHREQLVSKSIVASTAGSARDGGRSVALGIVPVVINYGGRSTNTCAFIDPGSDITLVSDSLVQRMNMTGTQNDVSITTVTHELNINCIELQFDVTNPSSGSSVHIPRAWSVKKLPPLRRLLPNKRQLDQWKHLQGIPFPSAVSDDVELLIGNDIPAAHWVEEQRRGMPHEPYAVRNIFGWMFLGPVGDKRRTASVNCVISEEINSNLSKLYDNEFSDIEHISRPAMSLDDRKALAIMEKSIVLRDGHYEIALPWKQGPASLPSSRKTAEVRLWQLRKRFQRSPEIEKRYMTVMDDYIEKGYAEKVPAGVNNNQCAWYLPHHAVLHHAKPDKVRVVFDCASQTDGYSLNQQLLSGPDLINNMIGVLCRFRRKPIAVVSDIESMFHQVRVPEDDRDALRFLWWTCHDKFKPPEEFRMCVHLFGATSSPSCASYALRRTISDNADKYVSAVSEIARQSFYVDDCLASYDNELEAVQYSLHLKDMLQCGGFKLTKWRSNRYEVVSQLHHLTGESLPPIQKELYVLGVKWNMIDDNLSVRMSTPLEKTTRRSILSFLATLYDPLGIIAPVVLIAKLLFQRLCKESFGWDERLPNCYSDEWSQWLKSVHKVPELCIPRCLLTNETASLHVFSDACERGFGVVIYLRMLYPNDNVALRFLHGKSRVAPNKPVTIPRLELAAAALAAKMSSFVRTELHLLEVPVTYWTDSLIVLHSIRNRSKRFPTYVTNRLCLIHSLSNPSDWRYVPSKQNPADVASRGAYANDDRKLKVWLEGPPFLFNDSSEWPSEVSGVSLDAQWTSKAVVSLVTCVDPEGFLSKFSKYTSWLRLQRAIAWLRRFISYLHKRKQLEDFPKRLSAEELTLSAMVIVRLVQSVSFVNEIHHLKTRDEAKNSVVKPEARLCPKGSQIYKLRPLFVNGILRVGGRLQNAPIPFEAKHPAILPKDNFVTTLLIKHYHECYGHVGLDHVLSLTRERYWIVCGRASIKKVLRKCFVCRRCFSSPCQQIMAPLPIDRVLDDHTPFSSVGIDYFGPLYVRRGRAVEKRYGCLFTCLKIRAVHLEVAHSLDTDSFLCAFSRFASRRGFPRHVYSDNGSNFVGAERDVLKLIRSWDQEKIARRMLDRECDWKFNPPNASHRGGVWERLIRSIKRLMLTVFPCEMITDEVLHTSLLEIEHIINSRPLTKASDDSGDTTVLTPNMLLFLRGETPKGQDVIESALNRRWNQAQRLSDTFWKKWLKQYLPCLNVVQKWQRNHRDLRVGDLVLLLDYSLPRGQWPKAVVEELIVSDDAHVRTVIVRTAKGTLRRDVRQLCLLEEDVLNCS